MDDQARIAFLRSKLKICRNGMDKAKEKGDMPKVSEWLENVKDIKKELDSLL